jgi:hypothetical protein
MAVEKSVELLVAFAYFYFLVSFNYFLFLFSVSYFLFSLICLVLFISLLSLKKESEAYKICLSLCTAPLVTLKPGGRF